MSFLAGLILGMLVSLAIACGGGGTSDVAVVAQALQGAPMRLAFDEQWEPRTPESGVFGVVWNPEIRITPDHSDPQQAWDNRITGRWGTLAFLDGTRADLVDVTGLGPNRSWRVADNRLYFRAGSDTGFALISRATFSRRVPITIEADFTITASSDTAFAGLALIAGEGDYREIAMYQRGTVMGVDRVAPLQASRLADARPGTNTLRLEYDPASGFRWLLNGALVGVEPIDHAGASFIADPSVALYFAADYPKRPGAFVEGYVGPVRVWVGDPVTKEAGNA